ncbi:MAG: putative glycolate oxidoreductase match [Pseudonocardiales bacterium]|nr:putative glycolate oxidoreductase match [Pseudonocardiales bacterium]
MTGDPLGQLRAALPTGRVSTDPADLGANTFDRSGWIPDGSGPIGVVFARDAADVQATMRFASEHGVPVVVRGAGTGLSGAATATAGSLVLSLARMDRIVSLDADDETIVVEPGVITAAVDAAAAEHGLRYAPDPGSVEISTIGGNIATNAGGLRCAKYGVTRDSVLGLDVVLATGELIKTGHRTVKGVTGYDLTGLFVGSEGTLGVIVAATLRLRPLPTSTSTIAAFFPTFDDAAKASLAITRARVQPAIQEIVDATVLRAIDAAEGTDFATRGEAFLLVQTDGAGAAAEAGIIVEVLSGLADSVEVTQDPVEAQVLLRARRLALPSLELIGRVLIEDIAVPRSRMPEAVAGIQAIAARHGVTIATLAHAGDGNLHPIIVVDPDAPEIPQVAWDAAGEIFALALRLGGTLTGEHGIGVLKRAWVEQELGSDNVALQKRLRVLFDPAAILNPGKVF